MSWPSFLVVQRFTAIQNLTLTESEPVNPNHMEQRRLLLKIS